MNYQSNTFVTNSSEETEKLAEKFAEHIKPSDSLLLSAELGGGKTTFTRGLVKGLGFDNRVISPTFTLQRKYESRITNQDSRIKTIYHLDLYRLKNKEELHSLDLSEMFEDPHSITIIEWPELFEDYIPAINRKIKIQFEYIHSETRKITLFSE